jgi:futalosine hydrolase
MPRTLVLVPTDLEYGLLEPMLSAALASGDRLDRCGFGPIAAAARTAALLATARPERVLLIGIAGRLDDRLSIGGAGRFAHVACHGVGAGTGESFSTAGAMGWPHWPGDDPAAPFAIGDVIACGTAAGPAAAPAGLLLTACAASATAADVRDRTRLFPGAVAEDMEGFAVALACRLVGVPLDIVRGISNDAGDRDKVRWQVPQALRAAADLAALILADTSADVP